MPHVKGLEILNDCEENQRLIQNLPDGPVTRWYRQVTKALTESKEFLIFSDFLLHFCHWKQKLHVIQSPPSMLFIHLRYTVTKGIQRTSKETRQMSLIQQQIKPTNESPADNASRGTTVDELLSSDWLRGPKFLWEKKMFPCIRKFWRF